MAHEASFALLPRSEDETDVSCEESFDELCISSAHDVRWCLGLQGLVNNEKICAGAHRGTITLSA
jgi:hypothetical protein